MTIDYRRTRQAIQEAVLSDTRRAADALIAANHFALATVTGAAAVPNDVVLGCLAGRTVLLWPDNDDAGVLHMRRIAKRLYGLGVAVQMVDPDLIAALPPGADAFDTGPDELAAICLGGGPTPPNCMAWFNRRELLRTRCHSRRGCGSDGSLAAT